MASSSLYKNEKVGIVGSGLIGRSFAMLFASAGYEVIMFDIEVKQVHEALETILIQLNDLKKQGLLRGKLDVKEQHSLIKGTSILAECIQGVKYVQECVPERIEIKKAVYRDIDLLISDKNTIIASSTSSMPASSFASDMKNCDQVIVAHPINPPTLVPLVEVVPTPRTRQDICEKTREIMREIGQKPVLLKKEVPGFAVNRVQYALLMECLRLVNDDVISVEDIDTVMTDGLGLRYAFLGPLETCHLNAEGMKNYCERYGHSIYDISSQFGPTPKMSGDTAEKIAGELEKRIPADAESLMARRQWRDARLAALAKLKRDMD